MGLKLVKIASIREHMDAHSRDEISYSKAVDLINEDANEQMYLNIGNIKAVIQGILFNCSQKSVICWSVEESDFEHVAEEIVKNLTVSQQREQLVCCKNCTNFDEQEKNCDKICINWSAYNKAN